MEFRYKFLFTFIIAGLLSTFLACDDHPENKLMIDKDRLTDLVVDMHYLEAIVQKTDKSQKDSVRLAIKDKIIHTYGIKSIDDLDSLIVKAQSYTSYFKEIQLNATSILDSLEKELTKKKVETQAIEKELLDEMK